ncbi:uncharacterized protein LOC108033567 [Drosophila biarmipes]|uniref:uncharacterized protein LOC108033567 n=1 Tax=Drosophila biarmipes TaxID=125945 RepID=UPI0007E62810|nr:uncharacterized protein LOC108033567 [Drosophila biarmipes]
MVGNLIKKLVVILFGLILAISIRMILPFTLKFSNLQIGTQIISCISDLTSTIFILSCLFLVSTFLAYLTDDWIVLGYVPLQLYVLHWTFVTFSERLEAMNKSYDTFMDHLNQKWLSYFNYNDTYWTTLEKTMLCCGLEGPRSYMDYLQKVPSHCYNPKLITLGCSHLHQNIFHPMQQIGSLLLRLLLFGELCILLFYGLRLFKKLLRLCAKETKKSC